YAVFCLKKKKFAVPFVGVGGEQGGGVCIGACQNQRGNVTNIGGQSCGNEVCDGSARRVQHFSPHVSAFFLARELIFQVHTRCARLDHSFDQFKNVERPAKTSFGVGHDRHEPIDIVFDLDTRDLVGALQSLIDPFDHNRHA